MAYWRSDDGPRYRGKEGANASQKLREAGVPGVKFKDSTNPNATNYVVFDENLIQIVRKYGIAGAATMLGVTAADIEAAFAGQQP